MDEELTRPYDEPSGPDELPGPEPSRRDDNRFRALTYGVMAFASIWALATILTNSIKPSKLTFVGFLACVIFYAGEFISWEKPKLPKRKPRRSSPWRDR